MPSIHSKGNPEDKKVAGARPPPQFGAQKIFFAKIILKFLILDLKGTRKPILPKIGVLRDLEVADFLWKTLNQIFYI